MLQAKDTVEQYQQARKGVMSTLQDAQELEQRAYDAGEIWLLLSLFGFVYLRL